MRRGRDVFLCSLIFFVILPVNWAVQGQLSEENLTNISLEDFDPKKIINYNISFNLSGTIINNNTTTTTSDTISSQSKKSDSGWNGESRYSSENSTDSFRFWK